MPPTNRRLALRKHLAQAYAIGYRQCVRPATRFKLSGIPFLAKPPRLLQVIIGDAVEQFQLKAPMHVTTGKFKEP